MVEEVVTHQLGDAMGSRDLPWLRYVMEMQGREALDEQHRYREACPVFREMFQVLSSLLTRSEKQLIPIR